MNIDNEIRECLALGHICINSYSESVLCATLGVHKKEITRVFSNRGGNHLILSLCAKVLPDTLAYSEIAERLYPYPLGVGHQDQLQKLAQNGLLRIFCVSGVIHVEHYVSTMQSLAGSLGPVMRNGIGGSFSQALAQMIEHPFYDVTCISNDPMQ